MTNKNMKIDTILTTKNPAPSNTNFGANIFHTIRWRLSIAADVIDDSTCKKNNDEHIIQEIAKDGAVTQVVSGSYRTSL